MKHFPLYSLLSVWSIFYHPHCWQFEAFSTIFIASHLKHFPTIFIASHLKYFPLYSLLSIWSIFLPSSLLRVWSIFLHLYYSAFVGFSTVFITYMYHLKDFAQSSLTTIWSTLERTITSILIYESSHAKRMPYVNFSFDHSKAHAKPVNGPKSTAVNLRLPLNQYIMCTNSKVLERLHRLTWSVADGIYIKYPNCMLWLIRIFLLKRQYKRVLFFSLTHCSRVDFYTLICWKSPFGT